MEKLTLLRQHFGHTSFRPGQEALIDALLHGRDALGVMPTGAGKSACYQLPAMLLNGVTLVISPLISLMKDQVAALSQAGISAAFINSTLTDAQYREVFRLAKDGKYKLLYIAPERLMTSDFLELAKSISIPVLAVDEAHCVSQWGQDFRPSYLKIAEFLHALPKRPAVGAFTATATTQVKANIEKLLELKKALSITTGFDRPNLYFEVVRPKRKDAYLREYVSKRRDQSGIIYCATRKTVEAVCESLRQQGFAATRYHAGLSDEERQRNQEDFVYDRAQIIVATNAFGMGIDKSNVSYVLHYNMPKNLESYYQEAGRAGRDGTAARCTLLYSAGDAQTAMFLIKSSEENTALTEEEREILLKRDMERLNKMIGYCKSAVCLRGYILNYFGERHVSECGSCGNCTGVYEKKDITVEAQKILSAVARAEKKYSHGFGITLIIRMLHGSKEKRILQLGLDTLPTYGIMHDIDRSRIRVYIDHLIAEKYMTLSEEYQVLRLTEHAGEVLFNSKRVTLTERVTQQEKKKPGLKKRKKQATDTDDTLLNALKALRTKLSQEENVPAYIVFSNATLLDMAAKQPISMEEFFSVSGVGEVKARRYGAAFLETIKEWTKADKNIK